ncbi:MAG: hypothetical protein RR632_07930, partial [Christensenella sp.]
QGIPKKSSRQAMTDWLNAATGGNDKQTYAGVYPPLQGQDLKALSRIPAISTALTPTRIVRCFLKRCFFILHTISLKMRIEKPPSRGLAVHLSYLI